MVLEAPARCSVPMPPAAANPTLILTGREPWYRPPQESAPFAVIGSNTVVEAKGQRVRGRLYPWGIVEGEFRPGVPLGGGEAPLGRHPPTTRWRPAVENQAHCDFVKLRNMLIRTHMHDLKDVTCDVHYENYRAHCIQQMTRCAALPGPAPSLLLAALNVVPSPPGRPRHAPRLPSSPPQACGSSEGEGVASAGCHSRPLVGPTAN